MDPVEPRSALLSTRIAQHAHQRPDDLAFAFESLEEMPLRLSWSQLETRSRRTAAYLASSGVEPGDGVLVLSPRPRDQVLGFLGAVAAGAVPSLLSFPSAKQSQEKFLEMLRPVAAASGARWLLCAGALVRQATRWVESAGLEIAVVEVPGKTVLEVLEPAPPAPAGERLFMQFSSGTTGVRKGLVVTQAMLTDQAEAYGEALGLGPWDRVASWLPLYHDMGLLASFLIPVYHGIGSVHLSPFEWLQRPSTLFEAVSTYRATLAWLPNFAYGLLASRLAGEDLAELDLTSLRALINCSEPVRDDTHRGFLAAFGRKGLGPEHLQACYAMAENTFAVTQTPPGRPARVDRVVKQSFLEEHRAIPAPDDLAASEVLEMVSSGAAVAGTAVRVAGAGERTVGEIEIRGGSLLSGYLEHESDAGAFTEDGWFQTGDLGYLADGELYVTGRAKDLIIHRGANVYPNDLEEILQGIEGVKAGRAVVFGVYDEEEGTESIVAMVETAAEDPNAEDWDAERLRSRIRAEVAARMRYTLEDVIVCRAGTLLKSTSGKLSRSANRALYLEGYREAVRDSGRSKPRADGPRTPLEHRLAEIWSDVLGLLPVGVTENLFFDLGADSVSAMTAVGRIREELHVDIDGDLLLREGTIEGQARLLRRGHCEKRGPVVDIQAGGSKLPLVLVHAAGGFVLQYVTLARHLGRERPVFALQDEHLHKRQGRYRSVEEMAAAYVEALVELQPEGPYVLGGWSFGGMVAFEMAEQLRRRGDEVARVVMFDSHGPADDTYREGCRQVAAQGLRLLGQGDAAGLVRFLESLGTEPDPLNRFRFLAWLDPDFFDAGFLEEFFAGLCEPSALAGMEPRRAWESLYARIAAEEPEGLMPGETGDFVRRQNCLVRAHQELALDYRPPGRTGQRVSLFKLRGAQEPLLWQAWTDQELEVYEYDLEPVPGLPNPHNAMMKEENVRLFGPDVRECLDEIEAREGCACPG